MKNHTFNTFAQIYVSPESHQREACKKNQFVHKKGSCKYPDKELNRSM